MITYRRKGIVRIKENWYGIQSEQGADVIYYRYLMQPPNDAQEFTTIWIDLTKDEDLLLSEMSKSNRHHIRKAAEYGLRYEFWHSNVTGKIEEFIDFFDRANAAKGLPPADGRVLRTYADCGVLDLSRVVDGDSTPLVWHAHYRDSTHARQTHTASVFRDHPESDYRTYLGRANRWAWWQDIRRFKSEGILTYDFGGWYTGLDNKELLAVNFFKEGFGGSVVKTHCGARAATFLGWLYLWAARSRGALSRREGADRD